MNAGAPELRLAEPKDLDAVAEFLVPLGGTSFAERFPGATPRVFYSWKYFANPLGHAIVAIATSKDSVVSVVAASPKRIWLEGKIVLAYELGDFLTRDDYRKQGLFSRLIELACQEAVNRGAHLVYVRPNDVAFPILTSKLSFIEAQRMDARRYIAPSEILSRKTRISPSLVRRTGIDVLFKTLCVPRSGKNVRVIAAERFGDEADQLWAKASRDYTFAVVRDKNYLNWRFVDCPTPYKIWRAMRNGDTAGFLVASVNRQNTVGAIVDVFTENNDTDAARALLATSMADLLDRGVGAVSTWTLRGTADSAPHRLLRRTFPFRRSRHLHLAFRILAPHEVSLPLTSPKWHFTLGDSDGA